MSSSESDEFEVIDQLEASFSPEELAKVQAWLQPTDYGAQSSEFHRHLLSQAPGTGLWICETSKYQQWQESNDHGSLWIKGVPGAGKSVTAASMIQHLQKTDGTPVLYFFFRYIISANRRPRSLVRDFLAQLLPYSSRLQATLQPLISSPLDDFSDERLWEYLLTGLSSIKKAYCVVDALDEMELQSKDGFLDRLNSLATFRPNAVKLLMTSRPKQYLQSSLRDTSIFHISLENDLVGRDISIFLSYQLKSLLSHDDQQQFRESLVSAISERSGGLFLYARLLLDQIIPSLKATNVDVKRLVKNLPVGLEEMYNSMLSQQARTLKIDVQIQVFLLELATHSSRALRLNEMASVLAATFPASMLPDIPKVVARSACAPLLEILEDETVSVIHHSFTEFLLNAERIGGGSKGNILQFPVLNPNIVHKKLSVVCMDYLRSGGLRVDKDDVQSRAGEDSTNDRKGFTSCDKPEKEDDGYNYQEAKLRHPFLEYAVGNWALHANKYDFEDNDFFKSLAGFLDHDSIDYKKWLELEWMKELKSSEIQAPTPLHVAAFAGLTEYAQKLLQQDASVDVRDAEERTPLHWACARGHASMVSLLLKGGATPNPEDTRGVKPIHEAARKNHAGIVKMLLEAGVDPLTPKTKEDIKRVLMCGDVSTKGETAVEYVWLQGHTDTIITLLPFLTPETLEELFCQCCRYGKFEAVRAILKATGLSPNSKSSDATALYLACRAQSVAIVELLVEKGADVNQPSEWKVKNRNSCGRRVYEEPLRLPIHGVVMGWRSANDLACQQILRLLLNAGANIDSKDANGDTPLLSLFSGRNSPHTEYVVVSGLLHAGADILVVDENGDSVLHRCLHRSKDIKLLKLLFEFEAHADVIGKDGNTVLHTAMRCSRQKKESQYLVDAVNLLLEKGARCDMKNNDGCTAIEEAARFWGCSLEIFTVLLQSCSDKDTLQRCMWKLTREKMEEIVEFIRVLQSFGVSLEHLDSNGATILLTSTRTKELFAALLECGADLHAVDSEGRGVLHHFVSGSQPRDCIQRLVDMVDMGLDPMQVDHYGNNLLHIVAESYTGKELDDLFVQQFLEYGLSVNSKNKQGMTPLHMHLENWDVHSWRNSVRESLDERFHERHQIPLLSLFRRRSPVTVDINAQDSDGVTIFHLAALRSETRMFYLLGEGADPTILTEKKRNALHLACRARETNVVGYLCQTYNKMVNQRDSNGRTPLHDACTSGCPESVRLLLKAGADITILDNNKRTPLHACAEFADEEKIWSLLSRPNQIAGHFLQDRFRPVFKRSPSDQPWYTEQQSWEDPTLKEPDRPNISLVIKTILSIGSDPMATDTNRRTPLDLAIEYDCREMIKALQFSTVLLRKKWDLKPKDRRLLTVLALKETKIPSLLTMNSEDPLRQEILENAWKYLSFLTLDDIEWISQHGGNITGVDGSKPLSSGRSLLQISASKGFTWLVEGFGPLARVNDDSKIVLQRIHEQLSIDPKYNPGIENLAPTLHVACARQLPNMDMVKVLAETCRVHVNARAVAKPQQWARINDAVEGGTALHVLANTKYWWQLEALKYLLQMGANIDAINETGETPLHIACSNTTYGSISCQSGYWRIECVKVLLESGANINILDNEGLSCLHKASSSPKIMRILLEHGADINSGKLSPLFSAIQIQCLETLTILLDAGVSPNIVDPNTGHDGFQLHYKVKDVARLALFCAAFARLNAQHRKHSAPIVKLLIKRGADVYAALNDEETLVHYVFENAESEIVSAFLDCADKIDFNTRDSWGRTVFLAACEWNECLSLYRHQHWDPKATAPFIQTLEFGADPLVVDNEGQNSLHLLLDNPAMEEEAIIQFLAHDANKTLLFQKNRNNFTPINCALRLLRPAVVEVLISMGVDLLSSDPTGATALHQIAAQCLCVRPRSRGNAYISEHKPEFYTSALALWKKFLVLGGSINVRDKKGAPPLFYYLSSAERDDYKAPKDYCCHFENFSTYFSEDVAKGLDFQAKNGNGENALHVIARREKKGRNIRGREQEHDHEPTHDKELYQFFMQKGLNPLEEDGNGRSSLDVAAACEQKGILELFQY